MKRLKITLIVIVVVTISVAIYIGLNSTEFFTYQKTLTTEILPPGF
ncbi:hypothetical protein SAMN02745218_01171 [Desulfofundulus australicus DSM 11792]|uniref:Uncharacterized protein n=1 Tax=Desulfofundulus australicus DSM 11792 TaxID=1121425 RepID=A0A1M4XUN2_9FIRM|nr:hypothetical protein [Desulfofundulus australicus]SHE96983.1 hypothetical protein SAMN02745218_01171 [Desulfofundulus australicus DSM 11792]